MRSEKVIERILVCIAVIALFFGSLLAPVYAEENGIMTFSDAADLSFDQTTAETEPEDSFSDALDMQNEEGFSEDDSIVTVLI